MIKSRNIMFIATGGKGWIGGLYYVKNIIYTLLKGDKVDDDYKIYILTTKENENLFKCFIKYNNIEVIIFNNNFVNQIIKKVTGKLFGRSLDIGLLLKAFRYKVDYVYPIDNYPYLGLKDKCVYWIPDFQHIHLPEMFSDKEIKNRDRLFEYIAKQHKKLILSSYDAFNDYKRLYPQYIEGVQIIQFMSDIEDEKASLDQDFIKEVKYKYNLSDSYIFLPNQFWKHKNHITAFKAIDYVVNKKGKNICLVCTGNTEDYRNKSHFNNLLQFIEKNKLENNIKILGFISRKEQLALMKASKLVIQPSLFEGWGTVVEDAKSLDKNIIMSDINVHLEQKNDKCILFKRENYIELGDIIDNLYSVFV